MNERAIVYARVSGDDRGKGNLSDQLEMGREYAFSKGYQIVAELAEDVKGASGYEMDLPQLTRALEMARDNALDVLIVRDLGRFARRLVKQLVVEREFIDTGIRVEYVLGKYPDTPEGRLHKNIEASIREWQREDIATRTARKRRKMVKDGNVITHGRPPYGYRVAEVEKDELVIYEPGGERQNGKHKKRERRVKRQDNDGLESGKRVLVIHKPEAQVVRMMFDWYVTGDGENGPLSMHAIAKRLTEMEIPTWQDIHGMGGKRRKRNHWVIATVSNFLSNETYMGIWYYGRNGRNGPNPREHWLSVDVPAIVSTATWEMAQARKQENKTSSRRNGKYDYLLRYRVRCGRCGTRPQFHKFLG